MNAGGETRADVGDVGSTVEPGEQADGRWISERSVRHARIGGFPFQVQESGFCSRFLALMLKRDMGIKRMLPKFQRLKQRKQQNDEGNR